MAESWLSGLLEFHKETGTVVHTPLTPPTGGSLDYLAASLVRRSMKDPVLRVRMIGKNS